MIDDTRLIVDNETQTVTYDKAPDNSFGWISVFGTMQIRPKDHILSYNGSKVEHNQHLIIHSWKIKVNMKPEDWLEIGVVLCSEMRKVEKWFVDKNRGYSWSASSKFKYGPITSEHWEINRGTMPMSCSSGDIVEAVLLFKDDDFQHCCLGYRHPGEEIEIAFDDLNVDEHYSLACALFGHKTSVQISG